MSILHTPFDVRADVAQLFELLPDHDLVIGMLRYGAHLPHLCAPPRHVPLVLSHMVGFESRAFYENKKIILLDDTIYRGTEMSRLWSYFANDIGISHKSLSRAVAVVHESSDYQPDFRVHRLRDADYIVWKESLASTIRGDIRPTERDYPLYYFDTTIPVGRLLSILRRFGTLHAASADGATDVFRTTLVTNASALQQFISPGLAVEPVCKVKLHYYTDHKTGQTRLVVIPMAFCRVSLPEFFDGGGDQILAQFLGLPSGFYSDVMRADVIDPAGFAYYLISRSLGSALLLSLLTRLVPHLGNGALTSLAPLLIDGDVEYKFPKTYDQFYEQVRAALPLTTDIEQLDLVSGDDWHLTDANTTPTLKRDPIIPASYQITEVICRHSGAGGLGVSHAELLRVFDAPTFVARAEDDLIDTGLLRALDTPTNPSRSEWERHVYSGGEFRAAEVQTLAEAWAIEPRVSDDVVREELFELWGPV